MKPVVLVHGAYHGAWCWNKVEQGLQATGIDVVSVDLPGHGNSREALTDLYGDALKVRQTLTQIASPPVLCGHSYGGAVITEAVDQPELVDHLVYLAALVPRAGELAAENLPEILDAPISAALQTNDDGTLGINAERAAECFYHDCTPEEAQWAVSMLEKQSASPFVQKLNHAPWQVVESTYVVCTEDRAVPLQVQERLSARCQHSLRIRSSHSPMLSQPQTIVELLTRLSGS